MKKVLPVFLLLALGFGLYLYDLKRERWGGYVQMPRDIPMASEIEELPFSDMVVPKGTLCRQSSRPTEGKAAYGGYRVSCKNGTEGFLTYCNKPASASNTNTKTTNSFRI
ncbi:Uncharacterised protein [Kingella potus]|uniref:Uncharacterized protein n=1 Tax=Kingella potus TaxID=265175 RepID=A0A377QXJ9_9NEIS|nr:hypothetical protein [Kingella potus]UOP01576.1 hypothetical protein LVJ84_05185 [Kingella potus]STR00134.1 Uncharacterised protein [Kingella potus]